MYKPRRYNRQDRNLVLLSVLVVVLAAALFVAYRSLVRAPEQKTEQPDSSQTTVETPNTGEEDDGPTEAELLKAHTERKENFYTILVSGVDDGNGGSDTNILVAVDTTNGYIYGVSIPRDTKAVINGKEQKINAAYSIGGMELMSEVISDQLGIPVDYTVLVDLKGFEALVNAIGGVNFNVPVNMNYDDPVQGLSIHINKGMQHLNGADALKVVRFRHNNDGTGYGSEDIGRMQTQQNFLKAVAEQTLTVSNLDKIDDLMKIFRSYVKTDLTLGNLIWLGKEAISIGSDSIAFSTLSTDWVSPYIYLDPNETLTLVNEYLNPYVEDRVAEDLNIPG